MLSREKITYSVTKEEYKLLLTATLMDQPYEGFVKRAKLKGDRYALRFTFKQLEAFVKYLDFGKAWLSSVENRRAVENIVSELRDFLRIGKPGCIPLNIKSRGIQTAKRKNKSDLRKDPAYQELVANIKRTIEKASAQGVDLFRRDDILTCSDCGAYEDVEFSGRWRVYDKDKFPTNYKEFILIDKKERAYHRNRICYCKMTYTFICSVCGAHQTEAVRDQFDYDEIH